MSAAGIWVLLRGLTRDARHWGDFPTQLSAALGADVHCLDLPGNGRLSSLASPCSVEAMADWCHEEIRHRGLALPCSVLALSLGGMVAVAWARRHRDDLDRMVLINTSLRPFAPPHWRMRPSGLLLALRLLLLPAAELSAERAVLRLTSRRLAEDRALVGRWAAWRRENPVSRRNALAQLMAAARYRAPTAPPLERLLLLASRRDGLVDARCSQRLARHWQVPLVLHPEAGHDLPLDDAAWVLDQVAAWLRA